LKELALSHDEGLIEVVRKTGTADLLSALRVVALRQARSDMEHVFAGETLESAHLLASMGTARMVKSGDYDSQALVYGEVEYDPFVEVLEHATKGLKGSNKFVDLGHGIGRAAIIAALTTDFDQIVGFEVIKGIIHVRVYEYARVDAHYNTTLLLLLLPPPPTPQRNSYASPPHALTDLHAKAEELLTRCGAASVISHPPHTPVSHQQTTTPPY
jgi:hypothetical protein